MMIDEPFEPERRRLSAMLPGARIEEGGEQRAESGPLVIVALVDDLDRPIPVLVERGGYTYPADVNAPLSNRRWLRWPATGDPSIHLHLVADERSLNERLAG